MSLKITKLEKCPGEIPALFCWCFPTHSPATAVRGEAVGETDFCLRLLGPFSPLPLILACHLQSFFISYQKSNLISSSHSKITEQVFHRRGITAWHHAAWGVGAAARSSGAETRVWFTADLTARLQPGRGALCRPGTQEPGRAYQGCLAFCGKRS